MTAELSRSVRFTLVGTLVLIWGSTWLVIKIGLEDLPPFFGAGLRFGLAAAILFVLGRARGVPWPQSRRVHFGLLASGLSAFALSYGALYWGEQYIPSGLAAVLFATFPFFVLILASFSISKEPITPYKALGTVLAFIGVAIIFRSDLQFTNPRSLVGAAVTLLSPLGAALSSVGIKKWGRDLHPYTLTTLPMAYGAAILLGISFLTEELSGVSFSAAAIGSIVYLAVFGSVIGFVSYYTLLRHTAVSLLAFITYTFPLVAVILGYVVLDETLERQVLAGAFFIVLGIALANVSKGRSSINVRPIKVARAETVATQVTSCSTLRQASWHVHPEEQCK